MQMFQKYLWKKELGKESFFENTECRIPHKAAVLSGLNYYSSTNLDFVDCVLVGYYEAENREVAFFLY